MEFAWDYKENPITGDIINVNPIVNMPNAPPPKPAPWGEAFVAGFIMENELADKFILHCTKMS